MAVQFGLLYMRCRDLDEVLHVGFQRPKSRLEGLKFQGFRI